MKFLKPSSGCLHRYEKLQHWELALEAYKKKALQCQSNPDELQSATLGLYLGACNLLNGEVLRNLD